MPTSFIESGFTTKTEYDAWIASGAASTGGGGALTLGYWKIRGLAAACRMMLYAKKQPYHEVAYGEDAKEQWFGGDKPKILAKNSLANLPYILDGSNVITQSNSCLLFLGTKLGIDKPDCMIYNHQALDQVMDLRNELMKIVYNPANSPFKPALEKHMQSATTHFTKLEGFCKGPYMCGGAMQSADFHIFEMVDQHVIMCTETGVAFDLAKSYPKLKALHAKMRAEPSLAAYFASDAYAKFAMNNAMYAVFVGKAYGDGPFGPTTRTDIKHAAAAAKGGDKKAKGGAPAQQAKQTPEEKAAKEAAKAKEKLEKAIIKEGGKKGVEIEGASDMGGLDFFCTTMELPEGNLEYLETSMAAMNAEPDPEAEDRKGCSGHVGKMIFSAGVEQLAIVAYVPDGSHNKSAGKVDIGAWIASVCKAVGGEIVKAPAAADSPKGGHTAVAVCKSDPSNGKFAIKDKDAAMAAAFAYLRANGAFPEDNDDDSDDMIFGDDDNLDDY